MSSSIPDSPPAELLTSAPKPSRTPHLLIFLTVLIDLIGFGIVIPTLPLYAKKFGAGDMENAWILAIYSLMQFIFSPLWGKLSDRIGRRPVLIVSSLGTAIGFIWMGLAGGLLGLFIARIIDGISGGNISTAQAYLADITAPEKRAKIMGMIGAAFGIGFVLGPAMAGLLLWLVPSIPNLCYFVAAAIALANTVFIILKLPESLPKEKRCQPTTKVSLGAVLQSGGTNLKFTMAAYFVTIMSFSIMTALFALFVAKKLGLESTQAGLTAAQGKVAWLMALVGIVGAVIQGRYIGRLAPKFGERRLAITGALILGAFQVILQETDTMLTFSIVSIGIAIGNALVTPCLNSLASRSVDGTMQGRSSGLMASSGSLGRVFGPLSTMFEIGKPFYMAGAIMVVALGLILLLKQPEPAPVDSPT